MKKMWFGEVTMRKILFLIFIIPLLFLTFEDSDGASMSDYCVIPPYVIQDIPPNVMIVLDTSGSMFNFSYFDGFTTIDTSDDNLCTSSSSPCIGFTDPGDYPNYKYYGYFDPDYWYTYSSNRFVPQAPKIGSGIVGARAKASNEWDGNFLNWLTMRRVDIIRKVLTGGAKATGEGTGYSRLRGEIADCDSRGRYKRISNAELFTPYSGARHFVVNTAGGSCNGGGSGTSTFTVRNAANTGNEATFNVAVRVLDPVEGVLQRVVGTRARVGLTFYNDNIPTPHGGRVRVSIAGGSLESTINEINNTRPNANTPLAETLWTVTGYFAQQASILGGPGPRYNSGDFTINNNNDPLNYGTGGSPRWPSCSKNFVLYITDGEPCGDGYLPNTLRDYAAGRSAYNCQGISCPAVGSFPASTFPSCYGGGESSSCGGIVSGCYVAGIEDVALYMHTTDLRNSPTLGVNNMPGIQNLTLFTVFAFGKGSTLLRYAAINGGFEDFNGSDTPDDQSEWDQDGDGEPDTYYEATDGYELERAIAEAFSSILKRAASGTAASVLASGEGSGANLVQAVFYPRRLLGNHIINWTGENQNFWYYVDPFFTHSSIREDTVSDKILNLTNDYIVQLYFDQDLQRTMARRFEDSDGDGDADSTRTTVIFENVSTLWKAGQELWARDISTDPRTIYTTIDGSTLLSGGFSIANKTTLRPYLQAANDTEAEDIIRYIHGEGLTTLKGVDEDGNPITIISGIDRNGDGIDDYRARYGTIGSETNVWKLGDVLNSTPRIASWIPLNNYDSVHDDTTYRAFIETTSYKNRGMVFAGGNDGMLHAFKLGKLELSWNTQGDHEIARLSGTNLGREEWAFIPKNALPYLKYFADPEYCHVFTVDLSPYIFDASIGAPGSGDISDQVKPSDGSTWRTILIGGMRFGGACRGTSVSCSDVSGDGSKDCVNTPTDVGGNSIGYSSYFALDITNQNSPQLLWEFSHSQLGFTTTGPAVVRIGADKTKHGNWFVVFGSGPTGPIDTTAHQFMGRSDQNLRFFVLDLKTGSLLRIINTGIQYAFAGSMLNTTIDNDLDYQDDAIYAGYVKRTGSGSNYTWTEGGIGRIFTREDPNPSNWEWRTLRDNIGPVTSSITKLQNNKKHILWLYFGTGRYYYELEGNVDDASTQRRLFGIKDPCFTETNILDPNRPGECQSAVVGLPGGLSDATTTIPPESEANSSGFKGWYVNLDLSGNYSYCEGGNGRCNPPYSDGTGIYVTKAYRSERVITDPLATPTGLVFFTTYKPYDDICGLGGKSFIWAVRYNTGGPAGALLKGVALLQVSTGSIEQIDLSKAFTDAGGRKTSALEGVPPTAQGLSLLSTPPPVKRVLHIKER